MNLFRRRSARRDLADGTVAATAVAAGAGAADAVVDARRARWWRWMPLWVAAGLLLFAPMAWALRAAGGDDDGPRPAGFGAAAVSGTIWSGRIDGARWRGLDLGDHHASLAPGAAVSGRLGVDLVARRADPALPGLTGRIEAGRGGWATRDLSGRVRPDAALARLGVTTIRLAGVDVLMSTGGCQAASGRITVRLIWPAATLSGPVACRAGLLHARLAPIAGVDGASSPVGAVVRELDVTLDAGGRMRARVVP